MQESLNTSLVRIRAANERVVGAGFLVGERQILTCAHVVEQALGLTDHPSDAPQGLVSLDFPLSNHHGALRYYVPRQEPLPDPLPIHRAFMMQTWTSIP